MSDVITLGCRLNIAESEAIRAMLPDNDLIVVNSCAVTEEAVRQTRRAIRRARRERPDARIVVTGCAAEVEREAFAAMPEVSEVVSNLGKLDATLYQPSPVRGEGRLAPAGASGERVLGFVPQHPLPARPRRAESPSPLKGEGFRQHARAFVEVQNGCDHRCTFCIIPYGRGPSRSTPAGVVIERIRQLVDDGAREVVLTGVDLTSYGDLTGDSLGLLVERILKAIPALPRLRLSSLDPVEIDERLFALIAGEPRLMPHLHLSLQAGDDMILKRMKRRHLRADAIRLVERIKAARPEVAIGADLIAGFPTETEAMFANSLRIAEECDIVFGHIFPYSPRRGTPAARMPQIEPEVIRARAKRLRELCTERQARWLDGLIGTRQRVLVELDGQSGHAENFAKTTLSLQERGSIIDLLITARRGDTLIGSPE
ncbi:putative MiaB-like tRNA modifying enzyme [Sphingomonas changbaiensis NBRC 104936]|uniref:Putative MiaB-like tRNA modifying enzyme n=1 Tax=Sphingomonas changbaiensis NBRC 104936 TaxID=1219043 RepID=A0A0E9MKR6_9SPHN|nr:tRNA (N(6)-L-threonylcarbamoyladenosine(37)-C(2))-methylthiotransferase MtaB [Sphingomonas changbaiensis]GAO38006.1 putative MiaB-like tRNA modifying enzyme [Sphingomonas changbaiensis NBRC 104936]